MQRTLTTDHILMAKELYISLFGSHDAHVPPTLDFLGSTKVTLKDLLNSGDSPWTKRLLLEDVKKGEIELRIELELNKSDLLL